MSTVAPIKCAVCTWEYSRQSAVDKHFATVHVAQSEQLRNLIKRYSVDTEKQLAKAIGKGIATETGAPRDAKLDDIFLDQMLEAEYQRIEGGPTNDERVLLCWAYDLINTPIPEDVIEPVKSKPTPKPKPEPVKIVDVQTTKKITRMFDSDKSKWLSKPRPCANGCGYDVVERTAAYGKQTYNVLVHTGIPIEIAEQVINHCVAK
jgi:hypothetical protein